MAGAPRNYSYQDISISFHGHQITGFPNAGFLTITAPEDKNIWVPGTGGGVHVDLGDAAKHAEVELQIEQGHPDLDIFKASEEGNVIGMFRVVETGAGVLVEMPYTKVRKPVEISRAVNAAEAKTVMLIGPYTIMNELGKQSVTV